MVVKQSHLPSSRRFAGAVKWRPVRFRNRNSTPEPLRETFGSLLRRWMSEEELEVYRACGAWREIVGAKLAEKSEPSEFRNGTLIVTVASAVWLQELQFLKLELQRKLNGRLSRPHIHEIVFRLGRLRAVPASAFQRPAPRESFSLPAPGELRAALVSEMRDPELARACERLLQSYARRQWNQRAQRDRNKNKRS